MACVSQLWKLLYRIPKHASTTGIFLLKGCSLKWLSISFAPFNNISKFSNPIFNIIGKPTDDHKEYLPPTQSQIGKILFSSIPNSFAFFVFAVTPKKCFFRFWLFLDLSLNQFLQIFAFFSVSIVPKDFDEIIKIDSSGLILSNTSERLLGSTLDIK